MRRKPAIETVNRVRHPGICRRVVSAPNVCLHGDAEFDGRSPHPGFARDSDAIRFEGPVYAAELVILMRRAFVASYSSLAKGHKRDSEDCE